MDKLIFQKVKSEVEKEHLYCSKDTHSRLKSISAETNLKMYDIVERCIEFALDHAVIADERR